MKRLLGSLLLIQPMLCGLYACDLTENSVYKVITVSYDYAGKDKSTRGWRAFMEALDRCHLSGYQDAQLAKAPQSQCKQLKENGCAQYHVTLDYDCIGMGYQISS